MIKKIISSFLIGSFITISLLPSLMNVKAVGNKSGEECFKFIQCIGLVGQNETFNKNAKINRGRFVSMALGLKTSVSLTFSANFTSSFNDVDRSNPYYDPIVTAESMGIISKNTTGQFRPDDQITKNEAVKIICSLLDYDNLAQMWGGFPEGYNKIALKLGFYKGLSGDDGYLTENDAAVLLANAVESDILSMTSVDKNGTVSYDILNGKTVLSERLKIKIIKGILTADCCTDIYSESSGLEKHKVLIKNLVLDSGASGIEKYIGYNLKTYYKDEADNPQIVYYELLNNDVVSAKIETAVFDASFIRYEDSNGKIKEKRVSSGTSYVLNGKLIAQGSIGQNSYNKGNIVLIDNNNDGNVDVVFMSDYSSHIVSGVDPISNSVYTQDGKIIELDADSKKYIFSIEKNGKSISADAIKRDDVLLFAESDSKGINKKQILISDNVIEAIVEAKSDNKITLESVEYDAPEDIYNSIDVGKYYKFRLDYFNAVTTADYTRDFVYGYLYRIENKGFNNIKCKIFTENNRWVTLDFADKIKFNNESKSKKDVYDILQNRNSGYSEIIRYNVNKMGQIKMMTFSEDLSDKSLLSDEAQHASSTNSFRKSFDGSLTWRIHSYSFDGKIRLNDKTKVFYIPDSDILEESRVISASRLSANSSIAFKAYDVDENLYANVIVVDELAVRGIGSGSPFMIVKKIAYGPNTRGDISPIIVGYWNANPVRLTTLTSTILTEADINNLSENDIILFNMDDDGDVISIRNCKSDENGYYGNAYHTSDCIAGGKIIKHDTENKSFVIKNGTDKYYISPYDLNTKVVLYDAIEDQCIITEPTSLVPGDVIIAKLKYFSSIEIIVIRK